MKVKTLLLLILTSTVVIPGGISAEPETPWKGNPAFPNSEQMKKIGLTQEDLSHLDGVIKFDVENNKRFDLTAKEINASSSEQLVRHFVSSPMRVTFGLYDNPALGVTRSIRSSATLSALLSRKDVVVGILRFYRNTPIKRTVAEKEAAKISLSLMTADEILMYPLVWEQVGGHEAQMLRYVCDRYRKMQQANGARKPEEPLYSAVFRPTYRLAAMIETKLRQQAPRSVRSPPPQRSLEEEEKLFERCEKLLREYEAKHKHWLEKPR